MNREHLEEIYIQKAAQLADTKAPVRQDSERAKRFVHETMRKARPAHQYFAWGSIAAFAVAAGLALVFFISPGPKNHGYEVMPAMDSVHASLDSLKIDSDSLSIDSECIQIISLD